MTRPSVSVASRKSPSGSLRSSTCASGSGRTFAGSFAMSALGISSRTCWNAHLANGGLRQLASVTCAATGEGKRSIMAGT